MPRPPLSARVRSLRRARGFTQAELAERAGVSPALVGFIETEERTAFETASLVKVAAALGASLVIDMIDPGTIVGADSLADAVMEADLPAADVARLVRLARTMAGAPSETKDALVIAIEALSARSRN